jgi:hypothetical protein
MHTTMRASAVSSFLIENLMATATFDAFYLALRALTILPEAF